MAGKDIISMSQTELQRLHIIRDVIDRKLRQTSAAEVLDLSTRQIRRISRRVIAEGDRGIIHRSRGKASNRKFSDEFKDKVVKIYSAEYKGFGPTFANEKLLERNKIDIGVQTLRNWLIEKNEWASKRKYRAHKSWRERKHHRGEMVQVDGSIHDWFEGRGSVCVLMGYIDDATGDPFGRFYGYEGTMPFMDSFKRYSKENGFPMSVYFDKHSTYKSWAEPSIEEELNNVRPMSQVERALKELGIEVIHANSPQAKGRIERLFRTFQDRLIKEMRLRNICSIEEGNKFLEEYLSIYKKRFSVKPMNETDLHRPVPRYMNLDKILCIRESRLLRNDYTIVYEKNLYQIEEYIRAKKVVIEERIDGSMHISYKGRALRYKKITQRPIIKEKERIFGLRKISVPSKNHPWKNFKISPYSYNNLQRQKELAVA